MPPTSVDIQNEIDAFRFSSTLTPTSLLVCWAQQNALEWALGKDQVRPRDWIKNRQGNWVHDFTDLLTEGAVRLGVCKLEQHNQSRAFSIEVWFPKSGQMVYLKIAADGWYLCGYRISAERAEATLDLDVKFLWGLDSLVQELQYDQQHLESECVKRMELSAQLQRVEDLLTQTQSDLARCGARVLSYFIEAENLDRVKIGKAKDPLKRLSDLQTSSCVNLSLRCTVTTPESILHRFFAKDRCCGEWFQKTPLLEAFIQYARDHGDLPPFEQWESVFNDSVERRLTSVKSVVDL